MNLRTCITPSGRFRYGIHKPHFKVKNLRKLDTLSSLGVFEDGSLHENQQNFPDDDVTETSADWIFEIPNAFPFRGTTYIAKPWADEKAADPGRISLPEPPSVSFSDVISELIKDGPSLTKTNQVFSSLPEPLLLALAATSTDPRDLVQLAELCCEFTYTPGKNHPCGLKYKKDADGYVRAKIKNHTLFEVLVNNIHLPDHFKEVMVLRPGVQGGSEIVGETLDNAQQSHIFEYLRRNSYIPWGHYAANMADDAIRYRIRDLTLSDMSGLRHLYYQRTYVRMADQLGIALPASRKPLTPEALEELRLNINNTIAKIVSEASLEFDATLWGWNYGFDFAPSKYRLHASHQQVHQQFAMIPAQVHLACDDEQDNDSHEQMPAFACGDMITDFITTYKQHTGHSFFNDYITAIRTNRRMDGNEKRENSLIIYEDDHILVFVPKAQTSQWEVQLMVLPAIGNIFETDTHIRQSLDKAMLITMKVLTRLGARMITTIEYAKRLNSHTNDQRLLYAFLPKLPESPGAFSEAQLRWINGHYPEDFAIACRSQLHEILKTIEP